MRDSSFWQAVDELYFWAFSLKAQHLNTSIEEVLNVLRGIFVNEASDVNNWEERSREAVNEVEDEEVESREECGVAGDDDDA
ncbi:hypothetical protein WUBG_06788 [Wuchereria bancrofti]|nr:hypothetical protein WUBG_06788 [Wuchereria bancrofti]